MKTSKKRIIQWLIVCLGVFVVITSFTLIKPNTTVKAPSGDDTLVIPEEINNIFDKSCFGCHNSDSKNEKAKEKLLIDKLTGLSKSKQVAKLDKISEIIENNEMPPEKFLARYPDKALTQAEAKKLREWADSMSEAILKK